MLALTSSSWCHIAAAVAAWLQLKWDGRRRGGWVRALGVRFDGQASREVVMSLSVSKTGQLPHFNLRPEPSFLLLRSLHCNLVLGPMSLRELGLRDVQALPGGIELLTAKRVSS